METVKLSKYLEDSTVGFVGSMSKLFVEDGVPLLRGQNILPFTLELTDPKFISSETHAKWKKSALNAGDVVLVRVGHPGTCCVIPEGMGELNAASLVILRTVKEKLDPYFLSRFFNSPEGKRQVDSLTVGSVQSVFNVKTANSIEIPDFALPEQRRIVDLIKGINDKIELNQKMNQTLEDIAKAIFKSWFVDFDPVRAKAEGRPTGLPPEISDLFPDELVDSEIGEIPKGWGLRRLDSLLELAYGKSLPAKNRLDGEVPVYGSGGVNGFHNESLVEGNSIVVGRKGTVGSLYWVDKPFFPIDTVFYVRTEESIHYCFYLMQTLRLDTMNTDAAVPGLKRDNAYRLEFPNAQTPPVNHFYEIAKSTRDRISIAEEEIEVLSELRDTLLPKLISG